MPNMLRKISVHNSRVTAAALAELDSVTLVSDDHNENSISSEQLEPTASPCNECEDECGGFLLDQAPIEVPDQIEDEDREEQESDHCNCNGRMGPCPLQGDCRKERSCIYTCKVTRLDNGESETYTGLAGKTFKDRFYGHNGNFNNRDQTGTKLSQYIWHLRDNNIPYETNWSILKKAKTFNPVTKKCRLCLMEVYCILYKPETASLNSRTEVFGWCRHM